MRLGEDDGLVSRHEISAATFYGWQLKVGGMHVSKLTAQKLLGVERSSRRCEPKPDRNLEVREEMVKLPDRSLSAAIGGCTCCWNDKA